MTFLFRFITGFIVGFEFGDEEDNFKFALSLGIIEFVFGVKDDSEH
jgi:hypothetical protein